MITLKTKLRENGVLYYLPEGIQNTFMRRSFYDILCDFWFKPSCIRYIKLIFKPLLIR